MRTNLQNDVKIENAKNFPSKFNLSGSYSSTASVGEVNVKFSRLLQPNTKAMCGEESLVFLAPLVAPTYAKQHYKTWHNFIPLEDVWANYSAFVTQTEISRNGEIFIPSRIPCVNKDVLSYFVLNGAKATLYLRRIVLQEGEEFDTSDLRKYASGGYTDIPVNSTGEWALAAQRAVTPYWSLNSNGQPMINIGKMVHGSFSDSALEDLVFHSGNLTFESFLRETTDVGQSQWNGYDLTSVVTMDKSDYNVYVYVPKGDGLDYDYIACFAFRLSSWGMHLFKSLRGLGYGLDVDAFGEERSILPLLATYKAYWDVFGLNLWQNFESTYCGRLITFLENTDDVTVDAHVDSFVLFYYFMLDEFGAMWITEKNDYVSAHLPQPVVSHANDTPLYGVIDTWSTANSPAGNPASRIANGMMGDGMGGYTPLPNDGTDPRSDLPSWRTSNGDGHAFITAIQHGHLDSEILKRLYKRTNANTALGRKIADLMRSQGLGTYMERTRVNYIGDTDTLLDVQSVISQSDTFKKSSDGVEGAMLGQRGGRGVGYKSGQKKLYYKTDCIGYWICLESITCDSGYSQSEDLTLKNVRQYQQYQPDFENLGLQEDSKAIINGSRSDSFGGLVSAGSVERVTLCMDRQPFGFAPRFSEYKVGRSTLSGGFALRSLRDVFLGYNMDKVILPDEFYTQNVTGLNVNIPAPIDGKQYIHMLGFKVEDVPTAGLTYRYLNRYPWMGNLLRIFAYSGQQPSYSLFLKDDEYQKLAKVWEYHYRTEDNYILLGEIWFKAWSNMVPIEETYGTVDSDKKELEYVERC